MAADNEELFMAEKKFIRACIRSGVFFVVAAGTGLIASFMAGALFRETDSTNLDVSSLAGLRKEIRITRSVLDKNNDSIADTALIKIEGVQGLELTYLLHDEDQDGAFDSSMAYTGEGDSGEALYKLDKNGDGDVDQIAFQLYNYEDPKAEVAYHYRDLDLDGRIDMVTLYQSGRPAGGYIMVGTRWHEYKRHLSDDWRRVRIERPDGTDVTAEFSDGKWSVRDRQSGSDK